uniref:Uncharacterized protein n=1 Tax=Biomphalaria glabrata TaxID=6526 RepID=A0A2C9KVE2_BIOGL
MADHLFCDVLLPLFLIIIFSAQNIVTFHFLPFDKSKSGFCLTGLLAGRDKVKLEFKFEHDNNTNDSLSFSLEAVSPVTNKSSFICGLQLGVGCRTNQSVSSTCYCNQTEDTIYVISYYATALLNYSKNIIQINGHAYDQPTFPVIYQNALQRNLTINNKTFDLRKTCYASFPHQTSVKVKFCVEGLHTPMLLLSYNGHNQTVYNEDCISVTYTMARINQNLYLAYEDHCRRRFSRTCYLQVQLPDLDVKVNQTRTDDIVFRLGTKLTTYILAAILTFILLSFLLILCMYT